MNSNNPQNMQEIVVIPKKINPKSDDLRKAAEIFRRNTSPFPKLNRRECTFCKSTREIIEFKGQILCRRCLMRIIEDTSDS